MLIWLVNFQNCTAIKKKKKVIMVSKHTFIQISLLPLANWTTYMLLFGMLFLIFNKKKR
jgi:hypothetical protein